MSRLHHIRLAATVTLFAFTVAALLSLGHVPSARAQTSVGDPVTSPVDQGGEGAAAAPDSAPMDPTVPILPTAIVATEGFSIPSSVTYGKDLTITGVVNSGEHISSVRLLVTDPYLGTEFDRTITTAQMVALAEPATILPLDDASAVGFHTFDLSAFNEALNFADLAAGAKTARVYVTDESGTTCVSTIKFTMSGVSRFATFWRDRDDHWVFPLAKKGNLGDSGFGSSRGGRAHAALDLMRPAGTKVYAMDDGVVQRVYRGTFYAGTGAVEVRHSDGSVALYGEVKVLAKLKKGSKVSKGQLIANVQGSGRGKAMLHLEVYAGTATGNLTVRGNSKYDYVTKRSYQRRRDLLNPTKVASLPLR